MKNTICKLFKKVIACVASLTILSSIACVTASAEEFAITEVSSSISSVSSRASARSYYDPTSFTFSNYNIGNSRTFDGNKIAFEINATSSSATTVTVEVHIDGTYVYSYDVPTNCGTLKYDQIPMGYNGNHSVYFVYRCSGTATVDMVIYSWVG